MYTMYMLSICDPPPPPCLISVWYLFSAAINKVCMCVSPGLVISAVVLTGRRKLVDCKAH